MPLTSREVSGLLYVACRLNRQKHDYSAASVKWSSSDNSVVSVSEDGIVTGGFVAVCIVTVNESSGILDIEIDKLTGNEQIYDAQGKKQNSIKKGLNIIRMGDGTTRKVVVK